MSKFGFEVGDKVLCLVGESASQKSDTVFFPIENEVYTIQSIDSEDGYLGFEEEVDNSGKYPGWCVSRFQVVEKISKTNLGDLLKAALDNPKKTEAVPNTSGGIKFDQGKIDYTYLLKDLPVSVEEVTKVLMYGAKKYNRSNYSKVESERYEAAFFRHVMAYLQGEQLDPETGYHHLAHAVCCLMFLIEREVKKEG